MARDLHAREAMLTSRIPGLAFLVLLAVGCVDVPTRIVPVDGEEVQRGTLRVTPDYTDSAPILEAALLPFNDQEDSCPALAEDAQWTLTAGDQSMSLRTITLGGGVVTVDCAVKCRDLVAFDNTCGPARAALSGPLVDQLLSRGASDVRLVLQDGTGQAVQSLSPVAVERRSAELTGGRTIATSAQDGARVPVSWSHVDDRSIWASDWPDPFKVSSGGQLRRYRMLEQSDGLVLSIGARDWDGEDSLYLGAIADIERCGFGECSVHHALSEGITLVNDQTRPAHARTSTIHALCND